MKTEADEENPSPSCYLALAELGRQQQSTGQVCYRKAGKELGIGHATVIRHIEKLTAFHRVTITKESEGKLRITPEGVHLAALAKVLRDSHTSLCQARSFGRPMLRLGSFHTTFRSVLPLMLRDFRGKFDLDLVEAQTHDELIHDLITGKTDLAFGWSGEHEKYLPELKEGELTTFRIGSPCEMVAIASDRIDPTFGGRVFGSLEEVRQKHERLILDKEKARLFMQQGILKDDGKNLILCQNMGTIIALVQRGLGIGIVWDMGDLLKDETVLKAVVKNDFPRKIQLVAFWRTGLYNSRAGVKADPMTRLLAQLGYRPKRRK